MDVTDRNLNLPTESASGTTPRREASSTRDEYPYNPRWSAIAAAAAFFALCAAFMGYKAAHNEAGLIINGLIELGPTGATVFYWVIAGASACFVLMAILLTLRRLARPRTLVLDDDALLLPSGCFQTRVDRINYSDISQVLERQVAGQTLLYIIANGLQFTIAESLLP
ncbi:MAG TPA: hypothetical protein VK615_01260, partial [Candidatus Binatia bacterium]|nr:hypothetical protein [Candidatus Binatia bacterium]